jgi:hypothetical protein
MPINTITDFVTNFGGGSRVNRFDVTPQCSAFSGTSTQFHIRASTLPASTITPIGINYFGRTVNIPGERVYEPWNISVLDDRGVKELYTSFKNWHTNVVSIGDNIAIDTSKVSGCNWTIKHYNNAGGVSKTFVLKDVWPVIVGPLVLDMSQDNVLATFDVQLLYTAYDKTI